MQFEVTRTINAGPARIWAILTDAQKLASGAFGIMRIEGDIAPGQNMKLWSEVSPNRAFPLKVSLFNPPTEMVWQGGMPLGAFTGTRRFELFPEAGKTRFTMRETYTGWMAGLIGKSIPELTPSFNKFADALKSESERT